MPLLQYPATRPAGGPAGVASRECQPHRHLAADTPDVTLTLTERDALAFDVLADVGCALAEAYGIAFALPESLRDIYAGMGNSLPERNAADDWRLPIPATFVIAPDGKVAFADVDADYRKRAEPADVVAIAESLRA